VQKITSRLTSVTNKIITVLLASKGTVNDSTSDGNNRILIFYNHQFKPRIAENTDYEVKSISHNTRRVE